MSVAQVTIHTSNIHSQRLFSGDFDEGLDYLVCPEDADEDEKLLKQAINLSLEEDTEEDGEEDEEELMVKKAIALSLEGEEENKKRGGRQQKTRGRVDDELMQAFPPVPYLKEDD